MTRSATIVTYPGVNPEATSCVSSGTRHYISFEYFGYSHHDGADQCRGGVPESNPPSPMKSSDVGTTFTVLPVDNSERRVGFANGTNFTPLTDSLPKAAKPASRQLSTYLLDRYNDNMLRGTRSCQTKVLLGTSSKGDGLEHMFAEVDRDSELRYSDSRRSSAFLAHEALQTSGHSPENFLIGKNIDSVGAESTSDADVRKTLTKKPGHNSWKRKSIARFPTELSPC